MKLTLERAKELVSYNPETGEFTRLLSVSNQKAGHKAGYLTALGYVQISMDGKAYLGHRLAWLLSYGEWPRQQIDHINRDRADNRLANLREVSSAENKQNCGARARNKSGFKGVHLCSWTKRWMAQITSMGKYHFLGRFDTAEEAAEAYKAAAARLPQIQSCRYGSDSRRHSMNSFAALEMEVVRWAEARRILPNSTPQAQLLKAFEEMGELASATMKGNPDAIKDGVGDTLVCLILFCALKDIDIVQCLGLAWEEIKDRKGYMSPEGIFIREQA